MNCEANRLACRSAYVKRAEFGVQPAYDESCEKNASNTADATQYDELDPPFTQHVLSSVKGLKLEDSDHQLPIRPQGRKQ